MSIVALARQYLHVIGFTSSDALYAFTVSAEKYGLALDDIQFDHQYCEARCHSGQLLTPAHMAEIALSGDVCFLVLNSVGAYEDD